MASVSRKKNKAPYMPRAGKTVAGIEYVTTHICPGCQAEIITVGCAYPQHVCARCKMSMTARSEKVGD